MNKGQLQAPREDVYKLRYYFFVLRMGLLQKFQVGLDLEEPFQGLFVAPIETYKKESS